jgi:hypothetical protein
MKSETIAVHVTPQVATAYRSASEEDRRRLELLVSLQLSESLKSIAIVTPADFLVRLSSI